VTDALILVVVVAGCYLAARWAFDWLAEKFFVVSGVEYLLLGILLGPQVSGVLSRDAIDSFAPIISLGLGWMGARLGSEFVIAALVRTPARQYRVALAESLLTLVFISSVMTVTIQWVFALPARFAVIPGVALGAIGTASTQAGVVLIAKRAGRQHAIVQQLRISASMNATVAVVVFGFLLSIVHTTPPDLARALTPTEWIVISIGIGVVGGTLFHLFLGEEHNADRLFIALAGGVILISGAATYLRLSPMLSAMCFGVVLVNSTRGRRDITRLLDRLERPLYFALLIFGGAAWQPSSRAWAMPVLLFLGLRFVAKTGAARLAGRLNGLSDDLGPNWGRGLLGQGGLALAIALNYVYHDVLPLPYFVFTAAVASLLLTDILSARFVRSLLRVDEGLPSRTRATS
jgi:hypothetical protein